MLGLPIKTPSLLLRHFVPSDAEAILCLNAEPSTRKWLPSHVYANIAESAEALAFLISSYSNPGTPQDGPYVLAVEQKANQRLLGHVGFSPLDGEVEVSYAIAEAARGQGWGTEALTAACAWVSRVFGVQRLIANTAEENAASRRMLAHAGFRLERQESRHFQGKQRMVSCYSWSAPERPSSGA